MGIAEENIKANILFVITNILCNSKDDVNSVVKSGMVSNIVMSLKSKQVKTKIEALWAISTLVKELDDIFWILN